MKRVFVQIVDEFGNTVDDYHIGFACRVLPERIVTMVRRQSFRKGAHATVMREDNTGMCIEFGSKTVYVNYPLSW